MDAKELSCILKKPELTALQFPTFTDLPIYVQKCNQQECNMPI